MLQLTGGLTGLCYVWHMFTDKGLQADPTKITAISLRPPPEGEPVLQCFSGVMNYLGKFIPNRGELSKTSCQLLPKDVISQDAFDKFKTCVTSPWTRTSWLSPVMDGSQHGSVGAAFLDEDKPEAYLSHAHTDPNGDKIHTNRTRELLAVILACYRLCCDQLWLKPTTSLCLQLTTSLFIQFQHVYRP